MAPALAATATDVDLSIFEELGPATWHMATVRDKASYGVWVDVEVPESTVAGSPALAQGLIHSTEMEAGSEAAIRPGDAVRVRVVHVDSLRGQLGLSMKGQPTVASTVAPGKSSSAPVLLEDLSGFSRVNAAQWLPGVVLEANREMALVEVEDPEQGPPKRGTVLRERVDGGEDGNPATWFKLGQKVHVRVLADGPMLELSMKGGARAMRADLEAQLERLQQSLDELETSAPKVKAPVGPGEVGGPLADRQNILPFAGLSETQVLKGVVHHSASFGVYVLVENSKGDRAWGLAHMTQLGGRGVKDFHEGAAVQVRVLAADLDRGRLTLAIESQPDEVGEGSGSGSSSVGSRALPPRPARGNQLSSSVGPSSTNRAQVPKRRVSAAAWVDGSVAEVLPYGLVVDLPGFEPSSGVVYTTEMDEYVKDPAATFKMGQEVRVRIVDEDAEPGLLGLSMRTSASDIMDDLRAEREMREGLVEEAAEEPEPTEQDLELRVMRERLKTFLSVPPSQLLQGEVQQATPFGVLVNVPHPAGGPPSWGLLPHEEAGNAMFGARVPVRIESVDTHRGVLELSLG